MSTNLDSEYVEILYNDCYGGFRLSDEAFNRYMKKRNAKNLYCKCMSVVTPLQ